MLLARQVVFVTKMLDGEEGGRSTHGFVKVH